MEIANPRLSRGTWLSDYVEHMNEVDTKVNISKPDCPLIGADGNIFNLMGIAERTLKTHGMEGWNTSNVTDLYCMFRNSGIFADNYDIGNIGEWDVSNVTDMRYTFNAGGMRATNVYIGDLSTWNTGKVQNKMNTFSDFGEKATSINIGNTGKWNVSNVADMSYMFSYFGNQSKDIYGVI